MSIAVAEPVLSSSSLVLGNSVTITHRTTSSIGIPRYTVTYSVAGHTGTLADKTSNTSTTWAPALGTFAGYITDATSDIATITVTTYDFSESQTTAVGSKSIPLTLIVPDSAVPTATNLSVAEGNTSLPSVFSGVYVKGYSKFKFNFTAAGVYSSKVKQVRITVEGKTYTSTFNATSVTNSITTDTLTQTGSGKSISYVVVDSRGRTVSGTYGSLTVQNYSVPQVSSFRARRSNGNTASATGTNAQRYIAASVSAVGTNSITSAVLWWKQKSASTYASSDKITIASSGTAIPSSGSAAWTVIAQSGTNVTFNGLYSYDFKLVLTDGAGNTTTTYTAISTISVMLDFNESGTGLGIGKLSENPNNIDSAWGYNGTAITLTGSVYHLSNAEINAILVKTGDNASYRGTIFNTTANQWRFRDWTSGGYWEEYYLPTPNATASGSAYAILTSKAAVTVAQGGTGATTASAALTNLGAVAKAGDTMTGRLSFKNTGSNWDVTTPPSANANWDISYTVDKNDKGITYHRIWTYASGRMGYEFGMRRQGSSATDDTLWNLLGLWVDPDGTRSISVSDASAWRTALGLGTMATQATGSFLSSSGGNLSGRMTYAPITEGTEFRALCVGNSTRNQFEMWVQTNHSIRFLMRKPNQNYYETYDLPSPTTTDAHKYYNILTEKFFRKGKVDASSVSANTGKAGSVTFSPAYTNAPVVVVCAYGSGAGSDVQVGVTSVTASKFDYTIYNATSSAKTVGIMWMAYAGY